MPSSSSIPFSRTQLPGHTGATTPSGFSASMGPTATVAAILEVGHTTITAYEIQSTTGIAVVDGTTLTWRGNGITLGNGDVVSLGENGLEDSTTTAFYQAVTVAGSSTMSTSPTAVVITKSSTTLTSTKGSTQTKGNTPTGGATRTTGSSTGTASAASTSSSGTAPTMGAGKALALIGALGGMIAIGL